MNADLIKNSKGEGQGKEKKKKEEKKGAGGTLSQAVGRTGRSCMGGERERERERVTFKYFQLFEGGGVERERITFK